MSSSVASIPLPDAPQPSIQEAASDRYVSLRPPKGGRALVAGKYARFIEPEYVPRFLGTGDKEKYALKELVDWSFPASVLISASVEQGTNKDPLYGKGDAAYGQRIGASAARQAGQIVFSDALFAPLFHEDPRYYVMGPGESFFRRFSYAATRELITRSDNGRTTPNFAILAGYLGSAGLTQLYYPVRSRDIPTIFSGYGFSLGGRALGYEIVEFSRFLVRHQPQPY